MCVYLLIFIHDGNLIADLRMRLKYCVLPEKGDKFVCAYRTFIGK